MASVNKVILVGNLGRDPEVREATSGLIANVTIATSETYTGKSGEKVEKTEWHRVVLFNGIARVAKDYLKKGASVYIEGRLQTRKWTDKEGVERYTTEIVADRLQMLGGRRDSEARDSAAAAQPPRRNPVKEEASTRLPAAAGGDFDDSVPF